MAKAKILADGQQALSIVMEETGKRMKEVVVPAAVAELDAAAEKHLITMGQCLDEAIAQIGSGGQAEQIKSLVGSVAYLTGKTREYEARLKKLEDLANTLAALMGAGNAADGEGPAPVSGLSEVHARMDRIVKYVDEVDDEAEARWKKIQRVAEKYRISS
jgi:hypothetical protein